MACCCVLWAGWMRNSAVLVFCRKLAIVRNRMSDHQPATRTHIDRFRDRMRDKQVRVELYIRNTAHRDNHVQKVRALQSHHQDNIRTQSQRSIHEGWRLSADIRRSPDRSPQWRHRGSSRTQTDCSRRVLATAPLSTHYRQSVPLNWNDMFLYETHCQMKIKDVVRECVLYHTNHWTTVNFTLAHLNKFAAKSCKRFPSHLNNVFTLLCETWNARRPRATIEL